MNIEEIKKRRDEVLVLWRKGDKSDAICEEFRELNKRIRDLEGPKVIIEQGWVDAHKGKE